MTDLAIRTTSLSKQYRIGIRRPHDTLRDQLADVARRSLRRRSADDESASTLWALRDVSFDVQHGEVLGIIGANGAGKSTLLKILARITEPTSGRVELNGRVGSLLEVGTGFHPELTGRENIYLNGSVLGMRRTEIARKFDEIVEFSEVQKFIETPVKRYSTGMYTRLAFAVAAHMEPEILLVDEVLSVGDASFQKKCLGKMGEISREGRTVLFVSHNLPMVRQLCTRGVLLARGQVERISSIADVIDTYVGQYEADVEELVFEPRMNTSAYFTRVTVRNSKNEKTARIYHSEPFVIEFEYEVIAPIEHNRLYWVLDRGDGTSVVVSGTDDSSTSFPVRHEPGRYQASMRFPGGILNSGYHTFRMEIRPANGVSCDYRHGGILEIIDDTDYGTLMPGGYRAGAILQRLEWIDEKV